MTLQYWREYRTLFHVENDFGVHESTVQRIVCKVEYRLHASGWFRLPPRDRALTLGDNLEYVLMDATKAPIDRSKKTAVLLQQQGKAPYLQDTTAH